MVCYREGLAILYINFFFLKQISRYLERMRTWSESLLSTLVQLRGAHGRSP